MPFPLSNILTPTLDALKVKLSDSLPAGSNIIGQVKLTDGTDALLINANGSINIVPINSAGVELFTATNPGHVQLTGSYDQLRIVKVSADTIVPAGTYYSWMISGTDFSSLKKFPFFAVVLSWKVGSTNLEWDLRVFQYMTNTESTATPVPESICEIDSYPKDSTSRTRAGIYRNLGNASILIRITNKSAVDQILTNLYVVGLDAV